MRDDDGHFYLIEPGYRFSSETSYSLYEKVDGFNSVRWCIETAIGIKHTKEDLPKDLNQAYEACVGSYHLFACKDGVIDSIEGLEEITSIENVVVDLPKRKGGKVVEYANMGLIRIYGNNIEEVVEKLKKVNELFSVKDASGENLFIRFTDYDSIKSDFMQGLKQYS
jgi:biotin carboxylase